MDDSHHNRGSEAELSQDPRGMWWPELLALWKLTVASQSSAPWLRGGLSRPGTTSSQEMKASGQ